MSTSSSTLAQRLRVDEDPSMELAADLAGQNRPGASFSDMFKHWAVYSIGSLVARFSGLLMLPIYTRFLTPEEYGIKATVVASVNLAALFMALGMRLAVLRFYFDDREAAHPEVVSTALISATCLATPVVGIALWCSDPLARFAFGATEYASYLRLGLSAFLFSYVLDIPLAYLQVTKQSRSFAFISIAQLLLALSLNILFIVVLRFGVAGLLYAELITPAFFCLLLVRRTLAKVGCSFSPQLCRDMLRYGAPMLAAASGWLLINTADRLVLGRYGSLSDVGIYSLANQFAQVLLVLLVQPFLNVWGPGQFEVHRHPRSTDLFPRVLDALAALLIISAFGISVFVDDVVRMVAAPSFSPAADLVPILALSYVLVGIHSPLNTGILVKKRTEYAGLTILLSGVLNLMLNLALVPTYLGAGAAASRVASLLVMVAATYWMSQKLCPLPFRLSGSLTLSCVALAAFALSRHPPSHSVWVLLPWKAGLLLSLVLFAWRTGMWAHTARRTLMSLRRALLLRLQIAFGARP